MINKDLSYEKTKDFLFSYHTLKEGMKEYYIKQFGSFQEEVELKYFQEEFLKFDFYILFWKKKKVGILSFLNQESIFLNELILLPEFQGMGIGTILLKYFMNLATSSKKTLELEVLKVNKKALKLYQSLGFIKKGENETHSFLIFNKNLL